MAWTRKRVQQEVGGFLRQYQRRGRAQDANDRSYDRKLEKVVKRMRPEDFQRAMDGELSNREVDDDTEPEAGA